MEFELKNFNLNLSKLANYFKNGEQCLSKFVSIADSSRTGISGAILLMLQPQPKSLQSILL